MVFQINRLEKFALEEALSKNAACRPHVYHEAFVFEIEEDLRRLVGHFS